MGKITFVVEGTTVGTLAEGRGVKAEYEVSETGSAKLVEAMADYHRADLSASLGPNGEAPEPVTIERILKVWFDGCVKQALRQTADYEKRKTAPAPIAVTGLE
jgi:hypothetical protein